MIVGSTLALTACDRPTVEAEGREVSLKREIVDASTESWKRTLKSQLKEKGRSTDQLLLNLIAEKPSETAIYLHELLLAGEIEQNFFDIFLNQLATHSPQLAELYLDSERNDAMSAGIRLRIVEGYLKRSDLTNATLFSNRLTGTLKTRALTSIIEFLLSELRIDEGLGVWASLPLGARDDATYLIAKSLSVSDLPKAVRWIEELPNDDQHRAIEGLLESVGGQENALLESDVSKSIKKAVMAQLIRNIAQTAPVNIANSIRDILAISDSHGLGDESSVASFKNQYLTLMARQHPTQVIEFFVAKDTEIARGPLREAIMTATELGTENTVALLEGLPEPHRAAAAETVATQWFNQDSVGLSRWLGDAPSGSFRDDMIAVLVHRLVRLADEEAARAWVDSISNAEMRTRLQDALTRN